MPTGKRGSPIAGKSGLNESNSARSKAGALPRRSYLPQTDVPGCVLADALRVPHAIAESYNARPTSPLNLAAALEMQPNAGRFRLLAGAAIAYGVTAGGPNAPEVSITPLGLRIVRPTKEGDELLAKREALVRPRVIGEFLRRYDKGPLPRADIALNVLLELGVPRDRADEVLDFIIQGAESVQFIREIKGKKYIDLSSLIAGDQDTDPEREAPESPPIELLEAPPSTAIAAPSGLAQVRRVFVTHGKNKALVEPIKKLLHFGELEAVLSIERTSVSQPVPDKVMGEMRTCGAAIIHVEADQVIRDEHGSEHVVLNPNVLIEVGAAMALYGRRFILLVKEGVKLPSNLQGLFEVRYGADALDGDATLRLLEAINDLKRRPILNRYAEPEA